MLYTVAVEAQSPPQHPLHCVQLQNRALTDLLQGTEMEVDKKDVGKEKTEFAKRNPYLEKFVPDAIENVMDAIMPDKLEKVKWA